MIVSPTTTPLSSISKGASLADSSMLPTRAHDRTTTQAAIRCGQPSPVLWSIAVGRPQPFLFDVQLSAAWPERRARVYRPCHRRMGTQRYDRSAERLSIYRDCPRTVHSAVCERDLHHEPGGVSIGIGSDRRLCPGKRRLQRRRRLWPGEWLRCGRIARLSSTYQLQTGHIAARLSDWSFFVRTVHGSRIFTEWSRRR